MKCAFPSSQFLDCSVSHLPVSCFPALLHTSMHTQRNNNFSKWAQPWAVKSRCKRRSYLQTRRTKRVRVGRGGGAGGGWEGGGKRRKRREEATVSHVQRQGCLSESKMGDIDWKTDERLWEGTVEEEEANYSQAESRSATNGNTRWLICSSQWQKPEIWVRGKMVANLERSQQEISEC